MNAKNRFINKNSLCFELILPSNILGANTFLGHESIFRIEIIQRNDYVARHALNAAVNFVAIATRLNETRDQEICAS